MTGLECLREELLKRGFNKTHVQNKLVAATLDILANTDNVYTDTVAAEKELEAIRSRIRHENTRFMQREFYIKQEREKIDRIKETLFEYIDKFLAALNNCETEEGRDAMRRAQMFVNSVTVDSKYDNTAYIIGLAAILSDGKIGAIDELRKINKKLFDT